MRRPAPPLLGAKAPQQGGQPALARFDGYPGRYVFHCHNLEREDMMMGIFETVAR